MFKLNASGFKYSITYFYYNTPYFIKHIKDDPIKQKLPACTKKIFITLIKTTFQSVITVLQFPFANYLLHDYFQVISLHGKIIEEKPNNFRMLNRLAFNVHKS